MQEKKKCVLITGGSSGIGLALAKKLNLEGYEVATLSRRKVEEKGIFSIQGDLSLKNYEKEVLGWFKDQKSDILHLIHNAGYLAKDSVTSASSEELLQAFKVNILGPQDLNKLLLPHMGNGSSVIYIGSTLSEKAVPSTYSYVVSKHAILGMMRATCQDLMGKGIHTACICPGFTDTEMLRSHIPDENVLQEIATKNSYGRLVKDEEIASTIKFVMENQALNGSIIHANLGQQES